MRGAQVDSIKRDAGVSLAERPETDKSDFRKGRISDIIFYGEEKGVTLGEGVTVKVGVSEGITVGEAVCVGEGVYVLLGMGVNVRLGVKVGVQVCVGMSEGVQVAVEGRNGVRETVGVKVGVKVAVTVPVKVIVPVTINGVRLMVGVRGVPVIVSDAVSVRVTISPGLGASITAIPPKQ